MKRWIWVLAMIAGLGGWIGWRVKGKRAEGVAQAQQREARRNISPMVAVASVQLDEIVLPFEAVGTIESPNSVKIAAKTAGRIDFLQVREGDAVTVGQTLVRLDPSQIEAQIQQRQAALAEARHRLTQAMIAEVPANVSLKTNVKQQEANVLSAQADYEQTKAKMDSDVASASGALAEASARYNNSNTTVAVAEANLRNAQAVLENGKARYVRVQNLLEKGFIAKQVVDDARTTLAAEQAAVDVAEAQRRSAMSQRETALTLRGVAEKQVGIVQIRGEADVKAAKAKVAQMMAALEAAKANRAQQPAYRQNIAALKADVEAAQAALKNAEAQRADVTLLSPLSGFITGRYADPGGVATPGQPLLAIQELRQVWATIPVPEEISRKVRQGHPAEVTFDALPGKKLRGNVVQVNPSADPASRQFTVRILLDNPQTLVKPGMFARASLILERSAKLPLVPKEALEKDAQGDYVMQVDEKSVAHRTAVKLGASDAHRTAILEGVAVGDKVVILSAAPLKEGQTVKVEGAKKETKK